MGWTFQQSGKQDSFRYISKSSVSMYESRVKIRGNHLTGHNFTNLVTLAVRFDWFTPRGKKKGKREVNSSEKNINMKLTLLKKVSKVFHFTDFFSLCVQHEQPF